MKEKKRKNTSFHLFGHESLNAAAPAQLLRLHFKDSRVEKKERSQPRPLISSVPSRVDFYDTSNYGCALLVSLEKLKLGWKVIPAHDYKLLNSILLDKRGALLYSQKSNFCTCRVCACTCGFTWGGDSKMTLDRRKSASFDLCNHQREPSSWSPTPSHTRGCISHAYRGP